MRAPPRRDASASSSRCTSFRGRTPRSNSASCRRLIPVSSSMPAASDRSRSRLDRRRPRSRPQRPRSPRPFSPSFRRRRSTPSSTAMATAVTPHAEPLARLAVEETGFGVVADKVQKNLFASEQVYRVHQADEDRRRREPPRGSQGHRDRRALRRGRGHRAVDESDVDGDLQDPHRAEGTVRDRDQPASVRREVHHARRRDHERGRARRRRARRRRSAG